MNAKKSKNKSRVKTANVVPEQNVTSEISDKHEVTKEEKCDNKESVEIITCENVPQTEQNITTGDTPVKPKRKKGKKKKQDESIVEQKIPDDPLNSTDNTLNVTEPSMEISSDVENQTKPITASRKKKNKKKQGEKFVAEDNAVKTENEVNIEISTKSDPIPQTPESTPKKKHKKKKHLPDSTKTEDVACISAFQQLLEPGDSHDETVRPDSQNNDSLPEVVIDECEAKIEAIQPAKNKKKNKKHRKHSPSVVEHDEEKKQAQEESIELLQEMSEQKPTVETSEVSKEASPKPKAKIAKPVDKKAKNKNIKLTSNVDNNSTPEDAKIDQSSLPVIESINQEDNILVRDKDESAKITDNIKKTEHPLKNVIIGIDHAHAEKEKCKNILNVAKNTESTHTAPQTEQEQIKESENTSFTEVRPSRKKKRSAKSISDQSDGEKAPSVIIDVTPQNETKPEQLEDANITPDFIHYPRSSSQLQFDNNNNTVIQEIHSPDEVRLGIPIFMSIPVVQGSGESPEVRSQMDPLDVEVTELKISELKKEDINVTISPETDNETHVMEELKLSIEKSLAELTAIEKADTEAEKQLVDIKQEILHSPVNSPIESTSVTPVNDDLKNVDIPKEDVPESPCAPPVCPTRKDKKGKSKKKGKKDTSEQAPSTTNICSSSSTTEKNKDSQDTTSKDKGTKSENTQKKEKQQSTTNTDETEMRPDSSSAFEVHYEPIENFEDALTSSNEDINKTFEMIAKEVYEDVETTKPIQPNPEISITEPEEDRKEEMAKEHPVSQPKNLLGQPNIPVSSNKDDYKKEKDKPPNSMQAKVKIKDCVDIERTNKRSKESQTTHNKSKQNPDIYKINENDDFVYEYSFRKVFLPNICHVCNKVLTKRLTCTFCNLIFYCSQKHKDEDWPKHQSMCFAICTIAHLKEQKFIYEAAKNITGQDYRLLRMQMIMSSEKMLKRKLHPWEQEALLYPRICANAACREWRQGHLTDCSGCGQVAFCTGHPEHMPAAHQKWCKSYALYQKLVLYQQTKGRLEPCLPSKVMTESFVIPEKINEVLASLYEERIEMDDVQYATLTQIASAPLTAAYSYQISRKAANGLTKVSLILYK
ncbi:muscle M-line assembly protein unc-89-like [Zerene cesonia]|uniref:muscle M-line assembly protein unc-89-like n=1 Tax=Zerene cesonia TaxID=33412 RepID=UPI0018E530BD|nr:muscle M-line assembly protein unc-89-like [Zerene cesonia]